MKKYDYCDIKIGEHYSYYQMIFASNFFVSFILFLLVNYRKHVFLNRYEWWNDSSGTHPG